MTQRRSIHRLAIFLTFSLLTAAAAAQPPPQQVEAVVAYAAENIDEATGLVKGSAMQPNVAESSPGAAAAYMLAGQPEKALPILQAILDCQDTDTESATYGQFRWYGAEGDPYSYDATLYALPVLGWVLHTHPEDLGEMRERLAEALSCALQAVEAEMAEPDSESYYLLQAACRASAGIALDRPEKSAAAADQVKRWLGLVTNGGFPNGHSQTFDALRLACLNWVLWSAGESEAIDEAVALVSADIAGRLWTPGQMLAGAAWRAYPGDYLAGGGVSGYILPMFGQGGYEGAEPFSMFMTLPRFEQLGSPPVEGTREFHTRSSGDVTATATYLCPQFTLGTMSGSLTSSSIPLLMQFPSGTPTAYAWASPAPARVASVQNGSNALVAFDFDRIGSGTRRQAFARIVLGKEEDIEAVHVHGGPWNNEPTGIAQRESLALQMHDCYVGLVIGRRGPVSGDIERRVKPGDLHWVESQPLSRLSLTIYGREGDKNLRRRLENVRVTFAVVVAQLSDYPSLADFAATMASSSLEQTIRTREVMLTAADKDDESPFEGAIIPRPKPKRDADVRKVIEQTIRFELPTTTLQIVEDMNIGEVISRSIDGEAVSADYLWSSSEFTYSAGMDLQEVLQSPE